MARGNVSGASLANRFAVVQSFGEGQKLQVLFHRVGDLEQDGGSEPQARYGPRDP